MQFCGLKEAFDLVSRLKNDKTCITGKFYKVLRNMYANSFAYLKLSGHLNEQRD